MQCCCLLFSLTFPLRSPSQGAFHLLELTGKDHSSHNENFTFNKNNPVRSVRSQIACTITLGKSSYHYQNDWSGRAGQFWLLESALSFVRFLLKTPSTAKLTWCYGCSERKAKNNAINFWWDVTGESSFSTAASKRNREFYFFGGRKHMVTTTNHSFLSPSKFVFGPR